LVNWKFDCHDHLVLGNAKIKEFILIFEFRN